MDSERTPVRISEMDWPGLLPFTRLFGTFGMAVHPPKLALALVLVLAAWFGGRMADAVGGGSVYPGEFQQYAALPTVEFDRWLNERGTEARKDLRRVLSRLPDIKQADVNAIDEIGDPYGYTVGKVDEAYDQWRERLLKDAGDDGGGASDATAAQLDRLEKRRRQLVEVVREAQPEGVFRATMNAVTGSVEQLVAAAAGLDFGFDRLLRREAIGEASVAGVAYGLMVTLPCWLVHTHCWFGLAYGAWVLALWSLIGGAIARMAALHATRDERPGASEAMAYSSANWGWFALTPVLPLLLAGVVALALALCGFLLFNLSVLSVFGGLFFFLALIGGAAIAFLVLLQAGGMHLYYPAIAVEGTDAFDAVSRSFGYVIGRPWRWLFYNMIALVYGAVTYLFITTVIFLTLWMTQYCVGYWAVRQTPEGVGLFEAMLPPMTLESLAPKADTADLNWFGGLAAFFVSVWVRLLVAVIAAYAVSYYICANTWIYLLLRQSADGTEYEDVYIEADDEAAGASWSPAPLAGDAQPQTGGDSAPVTEGGDGHGS